MRASLHVHGAAQQPEIKRVPGSKFNDISAFSVRKSPPAFKKPIPMTDRLRALDFVKEECPAILESDAAGYLVSIDVLLEAIILHQRLEDRSMAQLDAQELILALAPLPRGRETAKIPNTWSDKDLAELYMQCVVSYAYRRMEPDRSDEFKWLLDGMQYVPQGYQVPVLEMLFGKDVVQTQLKALMEKEGVAGGSTGQGGRGGASDGRPGGKRTAMPRFDLGALSGDARPPSATSYASESTVVEESPEERARRQAKNQKKNAQKKRKAARQRAEQKEEGGSSQNRERPLPSDEKLSQSMRKLTVDDLE